MRKFIKFTLLSIFFATNANAEPVSTQIQKSLELWQPVSVTYKKGVVKVISKERRVTEQIYQAMIGGICMGLTKRPKSLNNVREIHILNRFGKQGYAFEGGKAQCKQLNEMPPNRSKFYLLGKTHMHAN